MKKAIVIVLLISSLFSVFGTGMPVIDVAAIAQAIQSAITQVNQWNQQIKQWQSEYERIREAAAQISSGDFSSIVTGIASLADQMSGWTSDLGWAETSDWLETASDGSYSLLAMTSNYQLLLNNADALGKAIQANAEKLQESFDSGDSWQTGSDVFTVTSSTGDFITTLFSNAGRLGLDALNLSSDVIELLKISPEDAKELYGSALEGTLKKAGFNSYAELLEKIDSLNGEISTAEAELLKINASESANAYAQKQSQIEQLKTQLENLQALKESYLKTEAQLATISANQGEYEKAQKEKHEEELAKKQSRAEGQHMEQLNKATEDFLNADIDELVGVGGK